MRWNCFLKLVTEGKKVGRIKVREIRGRRHNQLLDDIGEMRKYRKMKNETLDRTLWRTCFVRGFGPVVGQTAE